MNIDKQLTYLKDTISKNENVVLCSLELLNVIEECKNKYPTKIMCDEEQMLDDVIENYYVNAIKDSTTEYTYNENDIELLYKYHMSQLTDDKKKNAVMSVLKYFSRNLKGQKTNALCVIGDIYYNMGTAESIKKSINYYRNAMYKGSSHASDVLYKIIFWYQYGNSEVGIKKNKKFAQKLYEGMYDDGTEDDDCSDSDLTDYDNDILDEGDCSDTDSDT